MHTIEAVRRPGPTTVPAAVANELLLAGLLRSWAEHERPGEPIVARAAIDGGLDALAAGASGSRPSGPDGPPSRPHLLIWTSTSSSSRPWLPGPDQPDFAVW